MRKLAYILLSALVFCGCQQEKANTVQCPNGITLTTSSSETIINKVGLFVEDYLPYVENIEQQCPLYRCIQASDYSIYVAMPVQLTYEAFKKNRTFGEMTCVDSVFSDSTVYRSWTSEHKEIKQLLYVKDKSSILMVGVPMNRNSSSLTYEAMVKRIQIKH